MKIYSFPILFCVLWGNTLSQIAKTNSCYHVKTKNLFISNINNIIEEVLHHQWEDEEAPCLQKTLDILKNVQNRTLWATWVWESMQSPTGVFYGSRNQFGNFDECVRPPWAETHPELKTQYCLVDIIMTDKRTNLVDDPYTTTDLHVTTEWKSKLTVNKLTWGLCLPIICKPTSVKKFAKLFLSNSHLEFALPQAIFNVTSCQSYNKQIEISYGYYSTLAFFASMVLLTLLSTYYYENYRHTNEESHILLIAKAFSIKVNNTELFKDQEEEIRSLNSVKFLTSYILTFAHIFLLSSNIGYVNSKRFAEFLESCHILLLAHGDILVDTFIMISGILLMNNFLARKKPINVFNIVIKRYFRLAYLAMVVILFTTQISRYHDAGPLGPKMALQEIETCRENWWTNLLMINNYVNFSKSCLLVTWSIACDFHLTILGTVLYWLYQKNKSLGSKVYIIGAVTSIVLPVLVSYYQQLSPIPFGDFEKLSDVGKYANEPTYLHSHLRSGPYFVGLALGFLFSVYKSADNKKLSKILSTFIFSMGFVLCWFIVLLGGYLNSRKYSAIEAALYVGTNRSIWAIGIGLMIFSSEYGIVPLVSDFLRWPGFGPLSKLNFGVYLTHWAVITTKFSNLSSITGFFTHMAMDAIGILAFCCGLAYFLWLVFEAPMNNIVAIILKTRSNAKTITTNGTSGQNGTSKILKKMT